MISTFDNLRQIFDALPYPVFAKNAKHQWIYGNKAFEQLIGTADYIGKDDSAYFPMDQVKVFRTQDRRVFGGEESLNEEEIGEGLFALTRKIPLTLPDGSTGLVAIILATLKSDAENADRSWISEVLRREPAEQKEHLETTWSQRTEELQQRLRAAESMHSSTLQIARTDATTGLMNRLGFDAELEKAIRAFKESGKPFGVAFIDVDRFKQINDRFGHAAGDKVLTVVGRRLNELPDVFAVARWGGDEFALLTELPNIGLEALSQGFEEARQYAFRPVKDGNRRIGISGSAGMAVYPDDATEAEELMRYADIALIRAKQSGRGRVLIFDHKLNDAEKRRTRIIRDLPEAIANGEIVPYYQPIICTNKRTVRGVEALARWTHKALGPIDPAELFELAHMCAMAGALDKHLRAMALEQVKPWLDNGLVNYLSLNISPQDIVCEDFAEKFLGRLKAMEISPQSICVEILESAIVSDLGLAHANLEQLSAAGVKIALDDYGTGFSNLKALLDLPLDKLKLDQSLVRALGTNNKVGNLLISIMELAKALDVRVVAEGIETRLQSSFITSIGCDLMQGYLFSPPLPYSQMNEWLGEYREKVA
jgi:diguanylate cyclase (GGDEF)-like protein